MPCHTVPAPIVKPRMWHVFSAVAARGRASGLRWLPGPADHAACALLAVRGSCAAAHSFPASMTLRRAHCCVAGGNPNGEAPLPEVHRSGDRLPHQIQRKSWSFAHDVAIRFPIKP